MLWTDSGEHVKKLVGLAAAGVCGAAVIAGGMTLGPTPAHAVSNCHAYGATTAAANRAIVAACREVHKGTPYSWGGGHHAMPGPSTGAVQHERGAHFDDRNTIGLDCSGLVRWAWYRATGTDIGSGGTWTMSEELTTHGFTRTGDTMPTRPGDVIVYPGHTAIYLGQGLVVQAANHAMGLNVAGLASEPATVTGVFRHVAGPTPKPEPEPRSSEPPSKPDPAPTNAPKPRTKTAPKRTAKPTPKSTPKPTPTPKQTHKSAKKPTKSPKPKSARTKPQKAGAVHQNVRADAPTYFAPVAWHEVGVLHQGKHRFDCQVLAVGHSYRGKQSNWWLKTDDTSGNHNVWISAAYLSGGADGARVRGVPLCTPH